MEAMILAAGFGTRLGELTRHTPKALVPVGGIPMIERVARRLIQAGVDRLIVNVHHHAEQIVDFVNRSGGFGIEVAFSHEPDQPLDTGGGLIAAAPLFHRDAPFLLHNVDVLSGVPLGGLYQRHLERAPLATLAVMDRSSGRRLLFDELGLFGRVDDGKQLRVEAREPVGETRERAFAGIHVLSPEVFALTTERGVFSILDPYLRLVAAGERVEPFEVSSTDWIDIGRPEQLEAANQKWKLDGSDLRPA